MRIKCPTAGVVAAASRRRITPRTTSASLLAAVALAGMIGAGAAIAHDYTLGSLRIDHPYSRPTPPGARAGGAYFTIRNNGKDADRLVGVASPVARRVELHSMSDARQRDEDARRRRHRHRRPARP